MLRLHPLGQEAQSCERSVARLRLLQISALVGNAKCGEAEASGGDARDLARIGTSREASVLHQPGCRVGLLPKEQCMGAFDFVEEGFVVCRECGRKGRGMWLGQHAARQRPGRTDSRQSDGSSRAGQIFEDFAARKVAHGKRD